MCGDRMAGAGPRSRLVHPKLAISRLRPLLFQKHFKGWRDQLVADHEGQQLPMAHTSYVDVHEVRAAIVPDSSAMQAQGCVTQF